MIITSDSAFQIGKQHSVCQDYSLSGSNYIIISDGCSASLDTDFGARLLSKICEFYIQDLPKDINFDRIISRTSIQAQSLSIPLTALDATLLCAWTIEDKYHVRMCGDGVLVKVQNNNTIEITCIEYPSGAPYYLSYLLDEERHVKYKECFSTKRIVKKIIIDPNQITNVEQSLEALNTQIFKEDGDVSNYKNIILFSDGILSFQREILTETSKNIENIPFLEVISKLIDFKSYEGAFVKRKVQKFTKDCDKMKWHHYDDLSMASLHFNPEILS